MNVISLLANDNYIVVNKELIKTIGLEESIVVGDLASMYLYLQKENKLTADGFFFYTVESMRENTTLSDYQQRKALDKLKKLGIVEIDIRELPAKRFIRLNVNKLEDLFRTSSQKTKELDIKKFELNNISISKDIDNNTINNNSFSKEKDIASPKKSLLGEEIKSKSKKSSTKKEDKNKVLADNIKKHLYKYSLNTKEIDLLSKWIDELYDKGKGIGKTALGVAIENLLKINPSKREEVIKKATLNGWRDFNYCIDKKQLDKLHFSNEIVTDEDQRNESLKEIENKLREGGQKEIDYF